jgi:hypothetical protein
LWPVAVEKWVVEGRARQDRHVEVVATAAVILGTIRFCHHAFR